MKKIIVHLGLPKTATTTLQHELFQKLHDQGKINFLGKTLDYNEKTGEAIWHNKKGQIIRDFAEGKITTDISKKIDNLLVKNKINIFSDEGLMVYYPGKENLPLQSKIDNLKKALKGYDVKVIITLRNPYEYMYSLYVQLHPDFFYKDSRFNSFEKYLEYFQSNSTDLMFESFNFEKVLKVLTGSFTTKVLLYEDMRKDKKYFLKELAKAFEIEDIDVKKLLNNKEKNVKKKSSSGTARLVSLKPLENIARNMLKSNQLLFSIVKKTYNLLHIKKIVNYRVHIPGVYHEKIKNDKKNSVQQILRLENKSFSNQYGLSEDKLKDYGYYD